MFLRASLSVCVHKLSVSSLALIARFEFHSDLCFPNSTQLLLLFSCLPACFSAAGVKLLFSVGFWEAVVVAKGGTHFSTAALFALSTGLWLVGHQLSRAQAVHGQSFSR